MRTCRPSLPACLTAVALTAATPVLAGGLLTPAPATVPVAAATRTHAAPLRVRRFNFALPALRDLVSLRMPASPASLLPEGWEPAASSSYADELHRTTFDLGLRHKFSGNASAQLGARITVLDCISIDHAGRFALGNSGSRIHGLIGLNYRY
jgi:hypothetical protein